MFTCNSTKLTSVPIIAYNSNVHFARNDLIYGHIFRLKYLDPWGTLYFKGGQYISLSDPQYFARGTTYFGPNLIYMVGGGGGGGTKYSVTVPNLPVEWGPGVPILTRGSPIYR